MHSLEEELICCFSDVAGQNSLGQSLLAFWPFGLVALWCYGLVHAVFKWLFSPCLYWLQHHYNRSERAAFLINWWDMSKKQHSIDNVYIVISILLLSASFSRVLWGPLPLWRCIIILSLTFFLKMSKIFYKWILKKKGNIEPKGISWASLAGWCLSSQWYYLLFNIHLFSIFSYTWFGT